MTCRVLAPGAVLLAVLLPAGCLDPLPTFGAPCSGDADCATLGVCFEGACVPKEFAGLDDDDNDDDGGPAADAGDDGDAGRSDAGGGPDAGPIDAGEVDAGAEDAGDEDAGDEDAGDDDAGADEDAGPIDAGFDAGPLAVCGDGVVEGSEACDWGDGRNGVGEVPCTSACVFDLSSPRRVNLDPLGGELSGQVSGGAKISADGRHVVFVTDSLDITNAGTTGRDPTYRLVLLDLTTGATVVINAGANAGAYNPSISGDGDVVVFDSSATNLSDVDNNGVTDVFAYRHSTAELTLVSKSPTTNAAANGASFRPWVDASGTTVVFVSNATDLVAGTPNRFEIFKADLSAPGQFVHVSTDESGGLLNEHSENPAVSGDGSTVAFYMYATDFFGPDTNGSPDTVFVDDQQRGYASRLPDSSPANDSSYVESISHDGNLITMRTLASNLSGGAFQQSVLFDKSTSQIHRIAWSAGQAPNAVSVESTVSGDGRYVAFSSSATNLVTNDSDVPDIYVRRVEGFSTTDVPTRVTSYNAGVGRPSMPHDGAVILFVSSATDVVANDGNGFHDVFLMANPLYP